jgi:DNA-binding response OmpR family regulator
VPGKKILRSLPGVKTKTCSAAWRKSSAERAALWRRAHTLWRLWTREGFGGFFGEDVDGFFCAKAAALPTQSKGNKEKRRKISPKDGWLTLCQQALEQEGTLVNLLLVEDERQLATALAALLRGQGYLVDTVFDGEDGEAWALSGIYDGIILDVMLPKKNGVALLRDLRKAGCATPVLLLTAKAEAEDVIEGLDAGADGYLTKPFNTGELFARVRALTRRRGAYTGATLRFGDIALQLPLQELQCGANGVSLPKKEYLILELLLQNSRQIIPKERFIEKIWGYNSDAEYNAIEVYVSFLRRKLAAVGSKVQIRAVRGVGYLLEVGA